MGYDITFGAQIELGADGLPVILSRPEDSSELRLFTCADPACSSTSTSDLSGYDVGSLTPSFAIDESGRPLIALVDERRASLDLIDCADAGCTDLESRSIATLAQGEDLWSSDALSLSLDARGNPIIAVGDRLVGDVKQDVAPASQDAGYVKPDNREERWAGTVIECAAARCGLR